MGIKLAIVGAGSSYCPELMQGLIRRKDKITLDELRLSDIDESRLSIVGDFCERVLSENGMEPRITRTTVFRTSSKSTSSRCCVLMRKVSIRFRA